MRMFAAGALAFALAALGFAAPAFAKPHAVIALLPPGPGETRPLLEEFASRGMAIGMTSPTVGGFKKRQMGLDMSQGTRIPTRLYDKEIGSLQPVGGRLADWDVALRRADKAPGDLKPGLFASTVEADGGRVGYEVLGGPRFSIAPIVAVTQTGGVRPSHTGDTVDVVELRGGAAGLRDLDRLLARRGRDGLVYVVRAPYGKKLRLLPSAIAGAGFRGQLWSATTRRDGLIAATDVAPTVLQALGIAVPDDMQGEAIEGRGTADARAVEAMNARLDVVSSRRGITLEWLLGSWLVALLLLRRRALRASLLGALWLPGTALLAAAIEPGRMGEGAIVGTGAVVLGLVTDRAVRWPYAPAVPAFVVFAAHAVDLGTGSKLIGASLAGPNPAGGARFFGIGNELEAMLSVGVLIGTGAVLAWRADRAHAADRAARAADRAAPIGFGAAAIVAAGIMGAGRLGADVGAVITLGAGGAAAVIGSLANAPTRRTIALGVAAPVAAIAALILVDVVTGGGAHLTKSVLHAHGSGDLLDVVKRRFSSSFSSLTQPFWALAFVIAVGAIIWLATRGRRIATEVPRPFAAGLIGAWFATVVGAIANDSGPLILEIGAILLLLAATYVRARPESRIEPLP